MSGSPGPARVLILDDEKSLLRLCSRVIQGLGALTDTAGLIAEAEALLRAERYDVFVSDMRLPDGEGLDLEGLFRERNPRGRLIVMTGSLMPDRLALARERKEIVFLSKPFELGDFRAAVMGMPQAGAPSEDPA